jgi:hypothetical protein
LADVVNDDPGLLRRDLATPDISQARTRVAVVTCSELPDLNSDDRLILAPLRAAGVEVDVVAWDAPGVAWDSYDLTVLRSAWDYSGRRNEFVAWASLVPRLSNPAGVVAWNTDKRYLGELAARGVPVVPTQWIGPATPYRLPDAGEWVIKPAVSAGSRDTGRYDLGNSEHRILAGAHINRLQAAARLVMLQPHLSAVDSYGETALIYVGGEYSHAIRKGPLLAGPDRGTAKQYPEEISARQPTRAEHAVAQAALATVPGGDLLYARVDLIPGSDGQPLLVELELTEPALFLYTCAGAAERFAAAIVAVATAGAGLRTV